MRHTRLILAGALVLVAALAVLVPLGGAPAACAAETTTTTTTVTEAAPPLEGLPAEGGVRVGPSLPTPEAPSRGERVSGGKESKPGLLDIPGQIEAAINQWFAGLVKDALDPAMVLVGDTLLSSPQITGQPQVRGYWQLAAGVADALLVLVVIAAGATVMGHETLQTSYTLKEIAPRIAVAAVLVNASLALCEQMVNFANVLATGLLGAGASPEQAGRALEHLILGAITGGGIFLVLLGLVCAGLAAVLLILYLVRAALIVFLVGASPIFLLAHGLPQTEGLARLWWRLMIAALGVQVAQALVLAGTVRIFLAAAGRSVLGVGTSGSLIDLLVALCLIYVLVRIPFWAKDLAWRRHSTTARMVRGYVLYRAMRGTLGSVL